MSRRSFGSLERLPSGRFRARYTGPDGRSRSAGATFTSKAEAERWLTLIQADMLRGRWTAPEAADVSLAEYVTAWQRQRAPQLRPRTRDLYARLAARWLLSPVGEGRAAVELAPLPLRAITAPVVREWHAAVTTAAAASAASRTARLERTHPARAWARSLGLEVAATGRLSPSILAAWTQAGSPDPRPHAPARADAGRTATAQAYRLLHAILAQAVNDGMLTTNPARIAGAGHVDHPERTPLTPAEVAALAAAVDPRYRAAILTAAWSGLRPGEVFALTRRDLDLEHHRLSVRQTLVEVPGQPVRFGPPKTAAGRRTIALPPFLTAALIEHLANYTTAGPDALVFTTRTGRPVTASARTPAMAKARTRIGRPDLHWHDLRHTGATLAAQAGATQAELQRRIGHASTRAAALYQHASLDRDHTLATALDALASIP